MWAKESGVLWNISKSTYQAKLAHNAAVGLLQVIAPSRCPIHKAACSKSTTQLIPGAHINHRTIVQSVYVSYNTIVSFVDQQDRSTMADNDSHQPADDGAPSSNDHNGNSGDNGGGADHHNGGDQNGDSGEQVKLYVGNLDYGEFCIEN
jgi:hypothetical protein